MNRSVTSKLFYLTAGASIALFALFLLRTPTVHSQVQTPKQLTWSVTATLAGPRGRVAHYRTEDPEYGIVCYVEHSDLSGMFACVKK